jgi:periplasmic protein TonB
MQSWEEILFDDRNKAYGSYQLRKKYTKYLFSGFVIAVLLILVPSSIAFYESKMLNNYDNLPYIVSVELDQLPDMESSFTPPPPMEKKSEPDQQEQVPVIVDSVPLPTLEKDKEKENQNKDKDSISNDSKGLNDGNGFDINGDSAQIYTYVDNRAEFPGGNEALSRFIFQHVDPELAHRNNIEGRVIVQFLITRYGEVRDASIKKSVHPLLDKEALRVIGMLPKWQPAKRKGRPVNTRNIIAIIFHKNSG